MICDAVGIIFAASHGLGILLTCLIAQTLSGLYRRYKVKITVGEEVHGVLVIAAARHRGVFQHAVLLKIICAGAVAAVLRNYYDVLAACGKAGADLTVDIISGNARLAVAAVAVGARLHYVFNAGGDEPLAQLGVLPVEGGVVPERAGEPVGMLDREAGIVHDAPCNYIKENVNALRMCVIDKIAHGVPAVAVGAGIGTSHMPFTPIFA